MRIDRNWAAAVVVGLGITAFLSAHSMDQAAILLDFTDHAIDAEIQLPAARLQSALETHDTPAVLEYILGGLSASLPDGRTFGIAPIATPYLSHVEGSPYVIARVRLVPPAGSDARLFDLHCNLLVDRLPSQVVLVSIRTDWRTSTFANQPQLAGVLRGSHRTVRLDRRTANWWNGFGSILRLGMRHIAEGTDHLLFLLVLLLPAPLLVVCGRWTEYGSDVRRCLLQIARVVTAFTTGHSVTLATGALNLVHVPGRPVEVLIAASILISAVHAFRPLFPGHEAAIAGSFGLVHGMAFATTLAELGLGRWERVASILGFNLGIETMQLLVVAAALPSLILLSRTSLYSSVRIAGALFAAAVAAAWIAQRLWDLPNPADAVVTALAQRAGWIAAGLCLLGIFARTSSALRGRSIL
jgi:HupE / UreJ protein